MLYSFESKSGSAIPKNIMLPAISPQNHYRFSDRLPFCSFLNSAKSGVFFLTIFLSIQLAQAASWPIKDFVLVRTSDDKDVCSLKADSIERSQKTKIPECLVGWGVIPKLQAQQELEEDLNHAATFYEKNRFKAPNLEHIRILKLQGASEFPRLAKLGEKALGLEVYPIRAASKDFISGPEAGIAMYLSYEGCFEGNERADEIRKYFGARDPNALAIGSSMNLRNGPSIVSAPYDLAGNSAAVQWVSLPHELFHAVQHAYDSVKNEYCRNKEDWYVEGMTEAMSIIWLVERGKFQLEDKNRRRFLGWRAYNYPLHEPRKTEDETESLTETYATSSFWLFLGARTMRQTLEHSEITYNHHIERLDDTIKARWKTVCSNLLTSKDGELGLPAFKRDNLAAKEQRISCSEVADYAGLYLVYPLFIADLVKTNGNYKDALTTIFPDKPAQNAQRKKGCFSADFSDEGTLVALSPVAAECFRLPAELAGQVSVVAEIIRSQGSSSNDESTPEPRLDHLFLSWNGNVHTGIRHRNKNSSTQPLNRDRVSDKKKWYKVGSDSAGNQYSEDLLLIFTNVAPKVLDTGEMQVRIRFVKDGGENTVKVH